MDSVATDHYSRRYASAHGSHSIQVQTYGLRSDTPSSHTLMTPHRTLNRMRDLDPMNIDQLLAIRGMVIRCSPIIPSLKRAYFRCFVCNYTVESMISLGRIEEPSTCGHCTVRAQSTLFQSITQYSARDRWNLLTTGVCSRINS